MNKIIKFFQKGTVIILITVPFLFCSGTMGQELLRLKLSDYKIASLTSFVRKLDTLKTDSNITTAKQKEPLKKFRMRKSPTVAVLLSAALPGAGQFYNESYWKIPVIGGLIGYFGYEYFRLNNLYKDYRDEYSVSQTPGKSKRKPELKIFTRILPRTEG